jgi:hypothetical protein
MRTFFPREVVKLDASSHCEGAEYHVGIGTEMWGAEPFEVLKVQMAYDGQVAGRKSPSFPILSGEPGNHISCPDFDDIVETVEKIINPMRWWLVTWDRPANEQDVSKYVEKALKKLFTLEDDDLKRPCLQIRLVEVQASTNARDFETDLRRELLDLNAPKGITLFVARLGGHESRNF